MLGNQCGAGRNDDIIKENTYILKIFDNYMTLDAKS